MFLVVDKSACKALDEVSTFLKCLRVWSVEEHITIDVLMPPSDYYYTDLFFQVINLNYPFLFGILNYW